MALNCLPEWTFSSGEADFLCVFSTKYGHDSYLGRVTATMQSSFRFFSMKKLASIVLDVLTENNSEGTLFEI